MTDLVLLAYLSPRSQLALFQLHLHSPSELGFQDSVHRRELIVVSHLASLEVLIAETRPQPLHIAFPPAGLTSSSCRTESLQLLTKVNIIAIHHLDCALSANLRDCHPIGCQ